MEFLAGSLLELITQTSTNLPPDVRAAMNIAARTKRRTRNPRRRSTSFCPTSTWPYDDEGAICQDTGMPTFDIHTPVGVNQIRIKKAILEAVAEATRRGKLRPNSVDSITGKNSGNNLGAETPVIHFEQWEEDDIEVKLILKGGGCENKNIQYSVPCTLDHLGRADRNLEGVRKCILHAVWQAQGQGCAPGALGVCIGSDRAHGYDLAKEQLFRTLDDVNPDPTLAKLEAEIMEEANKLGVGAMGFGGKSSLIGCKITAANRLPASFFVSVAYDCWAFRRLGVRLDAATGAITQWLYRDPSRPVERMARGAGFKLTGREVVLTAPLSEAQVRALKVGDVVLINGEMFTGRDDVHAYLMHNPPPVDLHGAVLYHCGPVMLKEGDRVDGQGRRPHHQHPRRALPGRRHQAVWRARGDGQRRHGSENAGGAEGIRRRVSQRHRRRGAVLRAQRGEGSGRRADGIRHSRSHVAPAREKFRRHRDHGRARQQPARRHRKSHRRSFGDAAEV